VFSSSCIKPYKNNIQDIINSWNDDQETRHKKERRYQEILEACYKGCDLPYYFLNDSEKTWITERIAKDLEERLQFSSGFSSTADASMERASSFITTIRCFLNKYSHLQGPLGFPVHELIQKYSRQLQLIIRFEAPYQGISHANYSFPNCRVSRDGYCITGNIDFKNTCF